MPAAFVNQEGSMVSTCAQVNVGSHAITGLQGAAGQGNQQSDLVYIYFNPLGITFVVILGGGHVSMRVRHDATKLPCKG